MKSEIQDGRYFIECACMSGDHLLTFEFYDDDDICGESYVSFTSDYTGDLWQRIKNAFKYIFNKHPYVHTSDYIKLDDKNLQQLQAVIDEMTHRIHEVKQRGIKVWEEVSKDLTYEQKEELKKIVWEYDFYSIYDLRLKLENERDLMLQKNSHKEKV